MKIELPKITRAMALGDYAPEMVGVEIVVWVNPPRAFLAEFFEASEAAGALQQEIVAAGPERDADFVEKAKVSATRVYGWWAEEWSQGPEGTQWTAGEIEALVEHSRDTDPGLWTFLMNRTWTLIREHREIARKN